MQFITYNPDFSLAFNIFAWAMVALGAIVVLFLFVEICWYLFLKAFQIIDKIINDY